ncbi:MULTISPECIES: 3-hydroxyacyl-CoA dehydrogenase [unclassified Paenibacillus]|uniref:3-hydroxyacyl-CoA dehydrogenase n=1 Tax=unclassified Paenibacillus TaxID=185978 RepID=UPI001AE422B0|nr:MULTISPECIES: 3-hydroxyacyl-CoA dehydrogenase [unclassified Paenibacillus]MBP1154101.1 3-hydroxybutyryl-CoA dehydrogenase [Paenibacillus sp. PvP091]MBP1170514.1 3-hydroxybutyryl-CoA dehydrogenase [Paenibacillus sp. PvR098]MBP2441542.1 3-hydroxybutyryl-CoA dehydrogenase [Paenibacillus sp. PvP052]
MIEQIVVVGGGVMGRGIAYTGAVSGFHVKLVDKYEQVLLSGKQEIEELFVGAIQRNKLTLEEAALAKGRLSYHSDLEGSVQTADLVIEAVMEKLDLKKQIFETLDQHAPEHCLLASNTSTLSPTEIGSFTKRPDKVMAMHFFNPAYKMKLIEMVRGLETSDETVSMIKLAAERMNKETVTINEFPGFVTSRMSALVGNEAFYMLMEGLGTPEEIDKAIKLGLNYPMGPLELADLVGLDARLNNLRYLHQTLGEKYRPCPLLVKYVQAGRLGRKTGRGVYVYEKKE